MYGIKCDMYLPLDRKKGFCLKTVSMLQISLDRRRQLNRGKTRLSFVTMSLSNEQGC